MRGQVGASKAGCRSYRSWLHSDAMGLDRHRVHARLRGYDYSSAGSYFVTIRWRDESPLSKIIAGEVYLGEFGRIVDETWCWLGNSYSHVEINEYVVMPDHLHGIITIMNDRRDGSRTVPTRKPLGRLIGAFKTVSTKRINQLRNTPSTRVWQSRFYDHVVRDDRDLRRIREYILMNPVYWHEKREPNNDPSHV